MRELEEFTFDYELAWTFYSPSGKPNKRYTEAGESFMSRRRNVDVALVKNGRPQSARAIQKARTQALRRFEEDARTRPSTPIGTLPANGPAPGPEIHGVRMSAIDVLRYCQLAAPVAAGDAIELPFDACQSPWPAESHLAHLHGSLRIDAKVKAIVSWRAWMKDGPSPGAVFFEQETQLAPGGIRLLARNHLNTNAAPHLFAKDRFEVSYQWRNPKRFTVDTKQTIASEPR